MRKLSSFFRQNVLFFGGLFILVTPYFFWYSLAGESYVLIHDNIDSEFVYIKNILEEGVTLSFGSEPIIERVMNGLPRGLLRSGLNFTFLLFALLSPITAYITNHLFVHIIGFVGMYLLLKRFFVKNNDWLVVLISLCFGFLSYYQIQYGISISGQPILLFAFLNLLYKKQKWYDWCIIVLFPFFSFLIVTLPFFVPFLLLLGFFYTKKNSFPRNFFLAILILCLVNLLVEIQLIYTTFFQSDIISHRTEWQVLKPSFNNVLDTAKTYFSATHYHSGLLDVRPILALFLIAILFLKLKFKGEVKFVFCSILFIIIWVCLNPYLVYFLNDFSIFRSFNSLRFYFILPFLWLLLLALILNKLNTKSSIKKLIGVVLLTFCLFNIIDNNKEYTNNIKSYFGLEIGGPNFNEFYAEDLFEEISTFLGREEVAKHNFLSLGIYPNIAQYNGFKTLDSYQNNYQLSYKHQFEKIIKEELNKNDKIKMYFINWGSRCYLFSSELGRKYLFSKKTNTVVKNLNLDAKVFKEMNGKYLISSVPIMNYEEINFKFLKSFSNSNSYWKLYLYKLDI